MRSIPSGDDVLYVVSAGFKVCLVFFFFHRNKAVLTSTISKLERRINELSDQMEDEHRIANEQKDLVRL